MVKDFSEYFGGKTFFKKFRGEPFDVKSDALQIDIGCSLKETEYGNVYCCVCVLCVGCLCIYEVCVCVCGVCYWCAMCVMCVLCV